MKIEVKGDNKEHKRVRDIPSGTLIKFTTGFDDYKGYFGIVLTSPEGYGYIIYDIEDDVYYDDDERYDVIKVYDTDKVKLVVE